MIKFLLGLIGYRAGCSDCGTRLTICHADTLCAECYERLEDDPDNAEWFDVPGLTGGM